MLEERVALPRTGWICTGVAPMFSVCTQSALNSRYQPFGERPIWPTCQSFDPSRLRGLFRNLGEQVFTAIGSVDYRGGRVSGVSQCRSGPSGFLAGSKTSGL